MNYYINNKFLETESSITLSWKELPLKIIVVIAPENTNNNLFITLRIHQAFRLLSTKCLGSELHHVWITYTK